MDTWLAPVGASHVAVPLRIAVKTLIGMLTIEATEYNVVNSGVSARR
jgi:hypothetical protein